MARSVTPSEVELLYPRTQYNPTCGGGFARPSLTMRMICATAPPKPHPTPAPTPDNGDNPNLVDGVDFGQYGLGAYSGPRNSVYRVSRQADSVCGFVGNIHFFVKYSCC